jgi:hypothetical protein
MKAAYCPYVVRMSAMVHGSSQPCCCYKPSPPGFPGLDRVASPDFASRPTVPHIPVTGICAVRDACEEPFRAHNQFFAENLANTTSEWRCRMDVARIRRRNASLSQADPPPGSSTAAAALPSSAPNGCHSIGWIDQRPAAVPGGHSRIRLPLRSALGDLIMRNAIKTLRTLDEGPLSIDTCSTLTWHHAFFPQALLRPLSTHFSTMSLPGLERRTSRAMHPRGNLKVRMANATMGMPSLSLETTPQAVR